MKLLHFDDSGQGEIVFLLHGLFGSLDNLGMIARGLTDKYRVISVDLPDHGQSYQSNTFDYLEYAEAIVALMDSQGIDRAHMLGHSMGGKVAMHVALNWPQKIASLMVADMSPAQNPARHDAVFAGLNAVQLQQIHTRKQAEQQMAQYIQEAGVRQFLLKSLSKSDEGWQWRFNLSLLQRDYEQILVSVDSLSKGQFKGPTLFIKGADSDYLKTEHSGLIQQLFPLAKARIMHGCGHWLHAQKPDEFVRIIRDFIQRQSQ